MGPLSKNSKLGMGQPIQLPPLPMPRLTRDQFVEQMLSGNGPIANPCSSQLAAPPENTKNFLEKQVGRKEFLKELNGEPHKKKDLRENIVEECRAHAKLIRGKIDQNRFKQFVVIHQGSTKLSVGQEVHLTSFAINNAQSSNPMDWSVNVKATAGRQPDRHDTVSLYELGLRKEHLITGDKITLCKDKTDVYAVIPVGAEVDMLEMQSWWTTEDRIELQVCVTYKEGEHIIPLRFLRHAKINALKKPKINLFETIVFPKGIKEALLETVSQTRLELNSKLMDEWGFGDLLEKGRGLSMLFYGPPGTGKTLTAEALANHLKRKLIIVGTAEIESSEPGGAERAIKQFFASATKTNSVLLFDECDSLIYNRKRIGMILAAQVNCLLSELERFDGVCIFTTNNTPVLDKAFERRLALKLEFPSPDIEARALLWKRMFPKPELISECVDFDHLKRYKIAGGTIKNIVLQAARKAVFAGQEKITMADIMVALKREEDGSIAFSKQREMDEDGMIEPEDYQTGQDMTKEISDGTKSSH